MRSACAAGLLLLAHAAVRGQTPVQPPAQVQDGPAKPLALSETSIPVAFLGAPYYVSVQATGGAGAVVMNLYGTLPKGLTFESGVNTLAISGIPQQTGTFDLQITATDAYGMVASGSFSLLLSPQSRSRTAVITDPETIHTTDTNDVFFPAVIADPETIHVTDTYDVIMPAVIKIAEVITVTDSDKVLFPVVIKISESITVTDSDKAFSPAVISISETIHTTDATAAVGTRKAPQ